MTAFWDLETTYSSWESKEIKYAYYLIINSENTTAITFNFIDRTYVQFRLYSTTRPPGGAIRYCSILVQLIRINCLFEESAVQIGRGVGTTLLDRLVPITSLTGRKPVSAFFKIPGFVPWSGVGSYISIVLLNLAQQISKRCFNCLWALLLAFGSATWRQGRLDRQWFRIHRRT